MRSFITIVSGTSEFVQQSVVPARTLASPWGGKKLARPLQHVTFCRVLRFNFRIKLKR